MIPLILAGIGALTLAMYALIFANYEIGRWNERVRAKRNVRAAYALIKRS